MPRKTTGPNRRRVAGRKDLAEQLARELKSSREYGQPFIDEQVLRTGRVRVTVVWDSWLGVSQGERTATIVSAYELAEGTEARDRVTLASGLTVPEAHALGMLPYQIITALRKGDPLTIDQARQAMVEEGGSELWGPEAVQLRFATEEEAKAAKDRLIRRLPGSDDVWIINREVFANDFGRAEESAQLVEG